MISACAAVPIRTNKPAIAIDFIGRPSFSPLAAVVQRDGHPQMPFRFLVALPPLQDLLFRAKHLLVAAIGGRPRAICKCRRLRTDKNKTANFTYVCPAAWADFVYVAFVIARRILRL
jgi:hypothetical protein